MRLVLFSITLWALFIRSVLSVPVPAFSMQHAFGDPVGYRKQQLDATLKAVLSQISEMKLVIEQAAQNPAQKKKIDAIFEAKVDMEAMKRMIHFLDNLAMCVVNIQAEDDTEGDGPKTIAWVQFGDVYITPLFFTYKGEDAWKRAGTLVHEASHLAKGDDSTHDHFIWIGEPEKSGLKPGRGKDALVGYFGQQYWKVVKFLGKDTWRNADSWRAFGYYVIHGKLPPSLERSPYWDAGFNPDFTPTHPPPMDMFEFQETPSGSPTGSPISSHVNVFDFQHTDSSPSGGSKRKPKGIGSCASSSGSSTPTRQGSVGGSSPIHHSRPGTPDASNINVFDFMHPGSGNTHNQLPAGSPYAHSHDAHDPFAYYQGADAHGAYVHGAATYDPHAHGADAYYNYAAYGNGRQDVFYDYDDEPSGYTKSIKGKSKSKPKPKPKPQSKSKDNKDSKSVKLLKWMGQT